MFNTKDFCIVVPVFNECNSLEFILRKIKSLGYLNKVIFIDDASKDGSVEILKNWREKEGIEVEFLVLNLNKEGAILYALEKLLIEKRLPDYVVIMDSDSYLITDKNNKTIENEIHIIINKMNLENTYAIAFKLEPLVLNIKSVLQSVQYVEYKVVKLINKMASRKGKLWVIHGTGGIYRSRELIDILRSMIKDFETGDLLITVNLMKQKHKIKYEECIRVKTLVPITFIDLFQQRRRWMRGVLKVIIWERRFYLKELSILSVVGVQAAITIITIFLLLVNIILHPVVMFSVNNIIGMYCIGLIISLLVFMTETIPCSNREIIIYIFGGVLIFWVSLFIFVPANIAAVFDLLIQYFEIKHRTWRLRNVF